MVETELAHDEIKADASENVREASTPASRLSRILWLGVPVSLATAFKLWLALTTYGTNDVRYWQTFMQYVVDHGSVTIYRDIWYYNHPPMMSGFLLLLHSLIDYAPNGFPFLIRLPAIVADVVSVFAVYRLVRFCWDEHRALICAAGVALSPVLTLVSGFHGNSDTVFVCLILLAAERAVIARAPVSCGALLGLAVNIKLVPLLVVPVLFFHFADWRERARFAVALCVVLVAGFGYHVVAAYPFMEHNVFAYSGLAHIWGITDLAGPGFPAIASPAGIMLAKMLIALLIVGRAFYFSRRHAASPQGAAAAGRFTLQSIGWAFAIFMLLTPGFSVQYLAWLAIVSYLIDPYWAIGYNVIGGAFAFSIYHYWNQGFPWNLADSDKVGAWQAPQALLGRMAWLYLLVWVACAVHSTLSRRTVARLAAP